MARPCRISPTRGKGSSRGSEISLIRGVASKIGINHRVDRNQFTFYSSGPKTTKKALQGEISVAPLNQKASGCNFSLIIVLTHLASDPATEDESETKSALLPPSLQWATVLPYFCGQKFQEENPT